MKLVFCILFHSVTDKSVTHRSYVSYILWLCSIIFVTYLMRIVSLIIPYTYSIFKRVMHIFMQQILRFLIMQEDINSPMSLFSFFSMVTAFILLFLAVSRFSKSSFTCPFFMTNEMENIL